MNAKVIRGTLILDGKIFKQGDEVKLNKEALAKLKKGGVVAEIKKATPIQKKVKNDTGRDS